MLKQLVLRTEQDTGQRWIEGRRMVNEILRGGTGKKRKRHTEDTPIEHVILFLTTTDWQREVWETWKRLPRGEVFSFLIHHKEVVPDATRFEPYSTQERVPTKWGDIVPAQILLLREGLETFPSATNFTFASGECVPLASPEVFYSNISGSVMPYDMIPWKEFITSKHEKPKDYAWYGHTWFSLNREHAEIAVNTPKEYYHMKARPLPQMTHSLEPDEFGIYTHLLSQYEKQVRELLGQKQRNKKSGRYRLIYKRNPKGRKLYPTSFYNALGRLTDIQSVQITDFVQAVDKRGSPTQHPIKYDVIHELDSILKTSKENGYFLFRKIKVEPKTTKQLVTLLDNIWKGDLS